MQSALVIQHPFAIASTFDVDRSNARAADAIEGLAWRDLVAGAPRWLREASGATAEVIEDAVVLGAPGLDHLLFNRAIGLGLHDAVFESTVVKILKRYKAQGIARYWIHANPYAQPTHLARLLAKRGLVPYRRSWVKMMRSADPISARTEDLHVRRADGRDAHTVSSIVGPAFDLPQLGAEFFAATVRRPRWHVFIVEHAGEPLAAGGMFVEGAYAYFAFAATRPEFRGRGAQRALMQARAELASALGCEWLVTETGFPLTADEPSPSYHNMLWAGFRAVAIRDHYCLPGTTWNTPSEHSL